MSIAAALKNFDAIADDLRRVDAWVTWELAFIDGKWTKPPYGMYGIVSTDNPKAWLSFNRAVDESAKRDGIGFVFHASHEFAAVDLDGCVSEAGAVDEWAQAIIERLDTYAERSPSRRGVRLLLKVRDKRGRTKIESSSRGTITVTLPNGETMEKAIKMELFAGSNYCTLTGDVLPGCPDSIEPRQDEFDALWHQCEAEREARRPRRPQGQPGGPTVALDDDEILSKCATAKNAAKFRRLFDDGSSADYGQDESSADSALACVFAFYTRDEDQIERLMRRSKLSRDKWNRRENGEGYLRRTIGNALDTVTATYTPKQQKPAQATPAAPSTPAARPIVAEWTPFPLDQLPPVFATFAREADAAIQAEAALVVLPLLTASGAAMGNAVRVLIKSGFLQPPLLWTANVTGSGNAKSPMLAAAVAPIHRRQIRALATFDSAMADYETAKAKWDALPKGERAEHPEPLAPTLEHVLVSDTTTEALAVRLFYSQRGVVSVVDELAGMLKSFNSYKQSGGDREAWLGFFDAGFVKIDRKTAAVGTITIPAAFVALTGGIQPGILAGIFADEEFDSGLAARFLFAIPPDRRGRRWNDATISEDAKQGVEDVFDKLFGLPLQIVEGEHKPRILPLSDDAKAVWADWYNSIEDEREGADDESPYGIALPKIRSAAARIALILQLVSWASGERQATNTHVDGMSMRRGVAIARWFKAEQRRVYSTLGMSKVQRRIVKLIAIVRDMGGAVTVRDWQRKRGVEKAEAESELETLVAMGAAAWVYQANPRGGHTLKIATLNDTRPDNDPENAASVRQTPSSPFDTSSYGDPDSRTVADEPAPTSIDPLTLDARRAGASANGATVRQGAA